MLAPYILVCLCIFKEWVSFFWVHGVWIVARNKQITREPLRSAEQTNHPRTASRFSGDLFVPRYDSYPMNQEKRHSFLIFTMFLTRILSKILREKLSIQNSHSNGHLTSFDVLITAHVIRSKRRTFCWLCSSGIELKNFSRVQRRKYDTIVNITICMHIKNYHSSNFNIFQRLPVDVCMYAVCQGAIGIECRENDANIRNLLSNIHDRDTSIQCIAERSFFKQLVIIIKYHFPCHLHTLNLYLWITSIYDAQQ